MKIRFVLLATTGLLIVGTAIAVSQISVLRQSTREAVTVTAARLSAPAETPFPSIGTSHYAPVQIQIVQLARGEYAKHPTSYDPDVLKYTDGNKEAWCADFASWMMQQVRFPYTNPTSGSWRIPGVFTLQEYYQSQHRYVPAGHYIPRPGDIAFVHFGTRNIMGQLDGHVVIVLSTTGDTMTTIGGNEDGKMRIDTQQVKAGVNGLAGFGVLGKG